MIDKTYELQTNITVPLAWLSVHTIIMQKNTFDVDEMDYKETAAILNQCICDESKKIVKPFTNRESTQPI